MRNLLVATSLLALTAAAPAWAQTTAPSATTRAPTAAPAGSAGGQMQLSQQDQMFLEKAASGGRSEVQLGQLAEQKGESEAVKSFGQRMIDDHSKTNDELDQIAQRIGTTLPTTQEPQDQSTEKRLSGMSGSQFDRAYLQHAIADHKKDIALFEHEAKSGRSPELKSFAQQTLPTLKEHLTLAQQAAGTTESGSSASPSKKGGTASGMSTSGKKASSGSTGESTNREMARQSSTTVSKKNAATDADTQRLNQQELGRLTQQ